MDIKCAAFALVLLTVTLDLTETRGPTGATGLVDNPHVRHKRGPTGATGLVDNPHVRHKRGPTGATGLVDNPHVRHKRGAPSVGIIVTRGNVKLHSDLQKREKRSVEEADILHNHHKGVAPENIMTRKKYRNQAE